MSTSAALRTSGPTAPILSDAVAVIEPIAETSPLNVKLPLAIRFVLVILDCGSVLSSVVYNSRAIVNDVSFRRGGVASIVYSVWLRAASRNDETVFNKFVVPSTFIKPTAVSFRADVYF